jgi:RimJ/RimL family protein N-acetyltransferase
MSRAINLPDPFTDGELTLRPPLRSDVPRITEVCRDPAIGHFTTVPVPYDEDAAHWWIDFAAGRLAEGTGAHLVVEDGGEVVAAVGLDVNPLDRAGRVGYWVAPDARGRGIATRAARLLCTWALAEDGLDLVRLELDAAAVNDASNAVAKRLGFTHEGTRRSAVRLVATEGFPEERADMNDWGLLRGELR